MAESLLRNDRELEILIILDSSNNMGSVSTLLESYIRSEEGRLFKCIYDYVSASSL